MKHKPRFLRDVRFYLANRHRFNFSGSQPYQFQYDPHGVDGLTAYKRADSQGKYVATRHPNIASTLMRTKASVNFQIKEWKAGARDGGWFYHELAQYLDSIGAPEWVDEALGRTYRNISLHRQTPTNH